MTHYTIDYSKLSEADAQAKALEDIKFFLGDECYADCSAKLLAAAPLSLEDFAFSVSFIGVQGYPALAWYNHLFPEQVQ